MLIDQAIELFKERGIFAVTHPTTKEPIFVTRGETGYSPAKDPQTLRDKVFIWKALRAMQTDEETEAALAGSVFGWRCKAAKAACPKGNNVAIPEAMSTIGAEDHGEIIPSVQAFSFPQN